MKNCLLLLALFTACGQPYPEASAQTAQDLSVEEIVTRSAEAMGGSGRLEALRTLRFQVQYREGGRDHLMDWEIIRPNKLRKEEKGRVALLFDGDRAGFLNGPPGPDGTLMGPRLVPDEDIRHFEMDIAWYIPAYFDLPGEYLGETAVEGAPAHRIRVILPSGVEVVYSVDAQSFLPVLVEFPGEDYRPPYRFGDFREVAGLTLSHRNWNAADPDDAHILQGLEVNPDLPESRFRFPEGIHQEASESQGEGRPSGGGEAASEGGVSEHPRDSNPSIVAACAEAMGGMNRIGNFRTLTFDYPPRGGGAPARWEIVWPTMHRHEREGDFILLFDGVRAGFVVGPKGEGGKPSEPRLFPEEEWKTWELDVAPYFPAFFFLPWEDQGETMLGEKEVRRIRVEFPLGGIAVYSIDTQGFLPVRIEFPDVDFSLDLGDFRRVDGILVPHRFARTTDPAKVTVIENVRVNAEIDLSRFEFPPVIR